MERPALVVAIGRPGDRWIHRTPDDAKQHADDVIYRAQSLHWNGRCIEEFTVCPVFVMRVLRRVAESKDSAERWFLDRVRFVDVTGDGEIPMKLSADGTLDPEPSMLRAIWEEERERYDAALDKSDDSRRPSASSGIVHDAGPEPEDIG